MVAGAAAPTGRAAMADCTTGTDVRAWRLT